MKILFVGDIMPGGVLPYQEQYIDNELLSYMHSFDLRIGTLECGVGTNLPFDKVKYNDDMSNVFVRDEDLFRLKEMDINVVTLANNHAFDLGLDGFENAIRQLDKLGIKYSGAGHDIEEARRPAVVKIEGKTMAFLGCMIDPPYVRMYHVATENDYGVFQVSIDYLCKSIAELKKLYDYVFVLPHWGVEHSYYPPVDNKVWANKIIDAGADAVIGSHPHIINPVAKYKGKPIYYSLGNFLFPDKCMQVPRPMYYPSTLDECKSLKRVWTYPYRINEPVVAVWRGKNRIGMMAEIKAKRKKTISGCYKLTQLTSDNELKKYYSMIFRLRFCVLGVLMKLPYYKFIYRCLQSRYNIVARILNRSKACNIDVVADNYENI